MSFRFRRPSRAATLVLAIVVILSAIACDGCRRPFSAVGAIGTRNRTARVGSEVSGATVTEPVASKRSSWRMTTGRGGPA